MGGTLEGLWWDVVVTDVADTRCSGCSVSFGGVGSVCDFVGVDICRNRVCSIDSNIMLDNSINNVGFIIVVPSGSNK